MTKMKAQEIEIPIHFYNYKLLKDNSFVLNGSFIYFVQGPNKTGKTSFLKALTSLQTASDDTPKKVSTGESEGYYEATIPASDGSMITVRHEFTDTKKGKFIAIREDGTKISSVTEIRNLFNYTPIDVNQFFALSNSAEGRRKQRDIILKLLPEIDRNKFNDLDLQEGHHYSERTESNKSLETAQINFNSIIIDPDIQKYLDREEEAKKLIKTYNEARDQVKYKLANILDIQNVNLELIELEAKLKNLKERKLARETALAQTNLKLDKLSEITIEKLDTKIADGTKIIEKIQKHSGLKEAKEKFGNDIISHTEISENLDEKINKIRTAKQKIVTNSDLPVENIAFEDDYLVIDGFVFKENQVCESDAVIILANILAKINPGPVQIIGDASILDHEKLEILNDIAIKNNKVMFVDEVIRDGSEMVVTGYESIALEDLKKKVDKVVQKGKKKSNTINEYTSNDPLINPMEKGQVLKKDLSNIPSKLANEQDTEEPGQDDKKDKPSGEDSELKPLF